VNGKAKKTFTYLPIIPHLVDLASNADFSSKMDYCVDYCHIPGEINDIFDGTHYKKLLQNSSRS